MNIRIPKYIKEKIDIEAEKNGRSRIAEILVRLSQTFQPRINEEQELEKI